MDKKLISAKVIPDRNVELRDEEWSIGGANPQLIRGFYTLNGKYIGDEKTFNRLWNEFGIRQFDTAAVVDTVCSIGFSPDENAWYGWSHRAISKFKVGTHYRGRQAQTLTEAKVMAREFAEDVS
jgi:hypothetical protein